MRVLVTGATGFIGSAISSRLVAGRRADVLGVVRRPEAACAAALASVVTSPRFSLRKADVTDVSRMTALMQAFEPDAVVHLANADYCGDPTAMQAVEARIKATSSLLQAVHGYWSALAADRRTSFRYLQVSSREVYGARVGDADLDESAAVAPTTPLAAGHAAANQMAIARHVADGLPVIVAHGPATHGPCQLPDREVPQQILAALEGRSPTVLADDHDVRDWLHVDDHAAALDSLLIKGRPGDTYIVGGGALRTNAEVAARIAQIVERHAPRARPRLATVAARTSELAFSLARRSSRVSKIESETGWRSEETFESGLARTVKWYLANEAWWRPLHNVREACRQLGLRLSA